MNRNASLCFVLACRQMLCKTPDSVRVLPNRVFLKDKPLILTEIVFFTLQPYLRRRKFKLFACFLEATMVSCTDGPVEFEVSIGWFFDLQ